MPVDKLSGDGIQIRWTAVPSGIIESGGDQHLRIKLIVAPQIGHGDLGDLRVVFSDWPKIIREELNSFSVYFGGLHNEEHFEVDGSVELNGLVDSSIWKVAFPSLEVRSENRGTPDASDLHVDDGLGSSYDAINAEKQLLSQQLIHVVKQLMPASSIEEFVARETFQDVISMTTSATTLSVPDQYGPWAQVPAVLGVSRVLPSTPSTEREAKLRARNLYRLSENGRAPYGTEQIVGTPFKRGLVYNALATNSIKDCVAFNSRVNPLDENEAPQQVVEDCDFFERIGMLRQYPHVSQKLGLTIEVRVKTTSERLKRFVDLTTPSLASYRIWVVPKWQRDGVVSLSPSTLFDLDLNQNIFRTSEVAEDGKGADPEHKDGYLLLRADQPSNQKWSLTTLDVDGSSVKAVNAATSGGEIIPKVVSDLDGTTLYANYSAVKLSKVCGKTLSEGDSVFSLFGHDISKEILSSLTVANLPRRVISRRCVLRDKNGVEDGQSWLLQAHLECFGDVDKSVCVWTLKSTKASSQREDGKPPAHRSPGIALVRSDADSSMHSAEQRLKQLFAVETKPGLPVLVASDLILGYVPEIWATPARDPNGSPSWHSLTKRREEFPLFKGEVFEVDGVVSLAVGEAVDAAPKDQGESLKQGNVSPSLFVYSNQSLGAPNGLGSFGLNEPEVDVASSSDPLEARLTAAPGSLPLVRYSSISNKPFVYSVRCRYVDVVGNTRALEKNALGPKHARLDTVVLRQEQVSPPRVLTNGRLDLRHNLGATLNVLVTRQDNRCDTRVLVPPKVSADIALRYGKLIDGNLRAGHFSRIQLDKYGEFPVEEAISTPSNAAREPVKTPVFKQPTSHSDTGYYYFPDPAARFVRLKLHTFYSEAFHLPPVEVCVPFYSQFNWPHADPITLNLCSRPVGEVAPSITTVRNVVNIFLPPGWVGYVDVASVCLDGANIDKNFLSHFAAVEAFDSTGGVRSLLETLCGTEVTDSIALKSMRIGQPSKSMRDSLQGLEVTSALSLAKEMLSPLIVTYQSIERSDSRVNEMFEDTASHLAKVLIGFSKLDDRRTSALSLLSGNVDAISPSERIELVSATKTPLVAPTLEINRIKKSGTLQRSFGDESIALQLESIVDEKSTGELSIIASWVRLQDDPEFGDPKVVWDRIELPRKTIDKAVTYETTSVSWQHLLDLGTTAFRRVHFRVIGLTRFSQYFPETSYQDLSRTGQQEVEVDILSSVRPRSPNVVRLTPIIEWKSRITTHQNRPKSRFEASSRFGIRVYMERGWEHEEMLGVITYPPISQHEAEELNSGRPIEINSATEVPVSLLGSVTQWGADPIVKSDIPIDLPTPSDFLGYSQIGAELSLPRPGSDTTASDSSRDVSISAFTPKWCTERKLWYCDIGFSQVPSYGCFIRLALCKFQPKSMRGQELSAPILADYMQLRSGRIICVLRDPQDSDERTLRITVAEPRDDGSTPISGGVPADGVSNMFQLDVEEPCVGENGSVIGWRRDEGILVERDPNPFGDYLCEWKAKWPKTTGKRRLVMREMEVFVIGNIRREREVFSCVLEV